MPNYRLLVNRTRLSTTLANDVYQRLKEYSDKTDIPITKILDRAVVMYLDSKEK